MRIPPFRREKTPSECRKVTAYRTRSALPIQIVTYLDKNCNRIIKNRRREYSLRRCFIMVLRISFNPVHRLRF